MKRPDVHSSKGANPNEPGGQDIPHLNEHAFVVKQKSPAP